MMIGITNWQQQMPIHQCYVGNNRWQIALNPGLWAHPISTDVTGRFREAIALAANGVPMFTAKRRTGIDAYLSGELDIYRGHCGRAQSHAVTDAF